MSAQDKRKYLDAKKLDEHNKIFYDFKSHYRMLCRGCSSVGRALESHSRGQGFDSPQLHQKSSLIQPV